MARTGLNELEQLILTALTILNQGSSGMAVQEHAEKLASGFRSVQIGAVYSALQRLEVKGYGRCEIFEVADRDGGSKRQFEITDSGHRALRNSLGIANSMIAELRKIGWHEKTHTS